MEEMVNPSPTFWSGRRVLVTGHTGFKGSWLAIWLDRLGAIVTGLALAPPSSPNLFDLAQGAAVNLDLRGDVRDLDAVVRCIETCNPEIVFHLAAQPLVREGFRDPLRTLATNVMGTAHVFEAARRVPSVRAIVNVTSDKCYQTHPGADPYDEDAPLGGDDPYSASKACAEIVTAAWRRAFWEKGAPRPLAASVRAGNVIGGGDWAADRLIPDCMRAWQNGRPVYLRYPNAVRPWQHVLEPLCGYLLVAERLAAGDRDAAEAWNFGPPNHDDWPASQVVAAMARLWGNAAECRVDEGRHPPESAVLKLMSAKARSRLGWQPRLSLNDTLGWTVDWYRRQMAGEHARMLCLEQIERYARMSDVP